MGNIIEGVGGLPRAVLWQSPTPLENQANLARDLGTDAFLVKRDDCNGLAFGGNKVRQMEYYFGDALSKGADTLLITGAVQSNFVRTAAAGCAKLGLDCHIQLENRVSKDSADYVASGNVLLDHLLGATIHSFPEGENEEGADANLELVANDLRGKGKTPYVVYLHPSHPPLGSLGYIDAATELVEQLNLLDRQPDMIFAPSGSGNTHAGLLYGLRRMGCEIPVTGVCVRRPAEQQHPRLVERLQQIADLLGENSPATDADVVVTDAFLAPGYGKPGDAAKEAIALSARSEALILDPVYTSKTMAGAIDWTRRNRDCLSLFIHTGGGPSIFGYTEEMRASVGG